MNLLGKFRGPKKLEEPSKGKRNASTFNATISNEKKNHCKNGKNRGTACLRVPNPSQPPILIQTRKIIGLRHKGKLGPDQEALAGRPACLGIERTASGRKDVPGQWSGVGKHSSFCGVYERNRDNSFSHPPGKKLPSTPERHKGRLSLQNNAIILKVSYTK